jgi:hypothetical protein
MDLPLIIVINKRRDPCASSQREVMLNLSHIIQRTSDVVAAEADLDLVMVSIENGLYYSVSDVGRDIWEAIERPQKISHLIDNLMASYDVDRSTCEQQTLSFLEVLLAERLLQVKDDPPS